MLKVSSVSFGGAEAQTVSNNVTAPKNGVQVDKKISTKTKVILGTTLAALAVVGIYIATKGKNGLPNSNTFEAFKQAGNKFEKGIALNKDGSKFSGTLQKIAKDGTKYDVMYKDGELVKVLKNGKLWKKYNRYTEIINATGEKELIRDGMGHSVDIFDTMGNTQSSTYIFSKDHKIQRTWEEGDRINQTTYEFYDFDGKRHVKKNEVRDSGSANSETKCYLDGIEL